LPLLSFISSPLSPSRCCAACLLLTRPATQSV
jgi:hypothetical protein